jgi:hypothetical protein
MDFLSFHFSGAPGAGDPSRWQYPGPSASGTPRPPSVRSGPPMRQRTRPLARQGWPPLPGRQHAVGVRKKSERSIQMSILTQRRRKCNRSLTHKATRLSLRLRLNLPGRTCPKTHVRFLAGGVLKLSMSLPLGSWFNLSVEVFALFLAGPEAAIAFFIFAGSMGTRCGLTRTSH